MNKTDQDQKIDILNKAQCGNDFFEVSKIENNNHFQFSFLAFAFDGEQAFDMVSWTLNDKVIRVSIFVIKSMLVTDVGDKMCL